LRRISYSEETKLDLLEIHQRQKALNFVGQNVKKTRIATSYHGLRRIRNVCFLKITRGREERQVSSQALSQTNLQLQQLQQLQQQLLQLIFQQFLLRRIHYLEAIKYHQLKIHQRQEVWNCVGQNVKKMMIAILFLGLRRLGNVFCLKLTTDKEERQESTLALYQ